MSKNATQQADNIEPTLDIGQRLGIITCQIARLELENRAEPVWPDWPPDARLIAAPQIPRERKVALWLHEQRHTLMHDFEKTLREFQRESDCPQSKCDELRQAVKMLAGWERDVCYQMTKEKFDSLTRNGALAGPVVARLTSDVVMKLKSLEDCWATTPKSSAQRDARLMAELANALNSLTEQIGGLRAVQQPVIGVLSSFSEAKQKTDAGQLNAKVDGTNGPKRPRPCDQKAFSQYRRAMEQQPTLKTDDEAYDWLKNDAEADDAPLPRRDHWKRYLRKARAFFDQRKNGPRIGNETRSVVLAKRLDTANRTKTDHR